ncbi:MAG: methyltransferase domain-containing protein [Spirochaetaceae bacterium]|nr:MAG: methyltransferase domain-containing protein [Spirochaetaceae bacterium]
MEQKNIIEAVENRYTGLAEVECCLSCGGAAQKAGITKGEVCVDFGSGRGTDVIRMATETGAEGFVYGIDATRAMIEKASVLAEKLGVKNATFIEAELDKLPLAAAIVDCVVSNCTINHASDKKAVWREIYRVLKPGGRFVVSDIYASTPVPMEYAKDPQAIAECWAGSQTRQDYLDTVLDVGFSGVHILEESEPYEKGRIQVSSFTIAGEKPAGCSCSSGCCS